MAPDYTFWLREDADCCFDLKTDPEAYGIAIDLTQDPAAFDE